MRNCENLDHAFHIAKNDFKRKPGKRNAANIRFTFDAVALRHLNHSCHRPLELSKIRYAKTVLPGFEKCNGFEVLGFRSRMKITTHFNKALALRLTSSAGMS